MSEELVRELAHLKNVRDDEIDMTGMPESLDWAAAQIGKYYRPIKQPVSLRIDADVLDWARSLGKGYQSQVNELMRLWMYACRSTEGKMRADGDRQTMRAAVNEYVNRTLTKKSAAGSKQKSVGSKRKNSR